MRTYRVSEVYATIQGEGQLTGTPVVLLRLQGCTVGCPWCDTKHSWPLDATRLEKLEHTPEEIFRLVRNVSHEEKWVLLTGGEPCEQSPLRPLVAELRKRWRVMLETSGTDALDCPELIDHICCSPKANMPGGKGLIAKTLLDAHEVKFVVGKSEDLSKASDLVDKLGLRNDRVSLQPLGSKDRAAGDITTSLCMDWAAQRGWRVSIQTHKLIGVP